jgi:NADH dehydrogenase [ubiquinone] 1 alpha subcomplex assembly factor 1
MRLIDFDAGLPDDWRIVNDGVMGGRSAGSLRPDAAGFAVFEGALSLENNGGFASFRATIDEGALAGAGRMLVRVRGDGRRYQLRLRPGRAYTGIAYTAGFDAPADQWTTVELPVDAFEPTFRGSRPPGAGPLDPARVGQVGIMLADKQPGPFRLQIAWIGWAD